MFDGLFSGLGDTLLGSNNSQFDQQNALMDKANAFNQNMASTQYQRAVADMNAAGINPMVAFAGGAQGNAVGNSAGAFNMAPRDYRRSALHGFMSDIGNLLKIT